MNFAENLKSLRNFKQLTQKDLAKLLGLSPNCICEWEKSRSEPSISSIIKLSDIFDVSIDYLLGLEDDFGVRTADAMHDTYTSEEREIISKYRRLPDKIKKLIRDQLEVYGERSELLPDKNKKV